MRPVRAAVTAVALLLTLALLSVVLHMAEHRQGTELADPLLRWLHPRDLTWLTFGAIYGSFCITILSLVWTPESLLLGAQAYTVLMLLRAATLALTPLAPPRGMIVLVDPIAQALAASPPLTKDLFFSGHTSTLFLFFLVVPDKRLKALLLVGTVVVGVAVLWQHVHYTVDVLAAPVFAYASYSGVRRAASRGEGGRPMANIETHPQGFRPAEDTHVSKEQRKKWLGGVAVETFAAVAAVVLAIVALAGLYPVAVGSIVAIALGASLLFEGLSVGLALRRSFSIEDLRDRPMIGDVSMEALAGLGAIVLGIISLANQSISASLLPAAAIVAGAGMLFAAYPILAALPAGEDRRTEEVVEAASGTHAFVGASGMVLGIIALVVSAALTVSLVAFLAMGATLLLAGAAAGGRVIKHVRD